jgi:hypothetical protein
VATQRVLEASLGQYTSQAAVIQKVHDLSPIEAKSVLLEMVMESARIDRPGHQRNDKMCAKHLLNTTARHSTLLDTAKRNLAHKRTPVAISA